MEIANATRSPDVSVTAAASNRPTPSRMLTSGRARTARASAARLVSTAIVATFRTRRRRNAVPSSAANAVDSAGKAASEKAIAITWTGTNW